MKQNQRVLASEDAEFKKCTQTTFSQFDASISEYENLSVALDTLKLRIQQMIEGDNSAIAKDFSKVQAGSEMGSSEGW